MHTESVRLNIILPKELAESLNRIAGPRNRSRIISESIRAYVVQKEKTELEKKLEEGYRAASEENASLVKEFEAVDLEGWDDY
jgi:metal-responsive CopG/Arc/MetJ family transcriptional regulator